MKPFRGRATLNRNHPCSRDLFECFALSEGGGTRFEGILGHNVQEFDQLTNDDWGGGKHGFALTNTTASGTWAGGDNEAWWDEWCRGQRTWAAWVNWTALVASKYRIMGPALMTKGTATPNGWVVGFTESSGYFCPSIRLNSFNWSVPFGSPVNFQPGSGWHHCAWVMDEDQDELRFYTDGAEYVQAYSGWGDRFNNTNLQFGGWGSGDVPRGSLESLFMWKRAYTLPDVLLHMRDTYGCFDYNNVPFWYIPPSGVPTVEAVSLDAAVTTDSLDAKVTTDPLDADVVTDSLDAKAARRN